MGRKSRDVRRATRRKIRDSLLSEQEREALRQASYEGSPYHKRDPGDFGLTPPSAPRRDATLCDEAGVHRLEEAHALFTVAIAAGLVSENNSSTGLPKHLWVVNEDRVFEATYGGSRPGRYHGYPIRRSDPLFEEVRAAWRERRCGL
jgi:hypothetical protein